MSNTKQWRGLNDLVRDAVEHGTNALERAHIETARRAFAILEHIPVISWPARAVRQVHDAVVSTTFATVRVTSRALAVAADIALDVLEN